MIRQQTWRAAHKWFALALGLHWLLLAMSGCVLAFHREIESAWMGAGEPIAVEPDVEVAIATAEAHTGIPARVVVIEDDPVRALRVISGDRIDTVDARSGELLSSSGLGGGFSPTGLIRFVYVLHYQLSAGHTGEWLVGISGAFLLVTVLIGLFIGWPAKGAWLRTLKPRLVGKPWHRHYAVHRATGLIVSIGLISTSISGMGMIWGDSLVGQDNVASRPEPGQLGHVPSPNEAIAIASSAVPGSAFVRIDLPSPERHSFIVRLREPGEFRPTFGTSMVEIAATDGTILAIAPASAASAGKRTVDAMFPIHNGSWLGIGGRILVLLQGMALIYLAFSGTSVWLAKRKRR